MSYVLAGLLQLGFWLVVFSVSLWLVRRFAPSLEGPLFNMGFVAGCRALIARIRSRRQGFQVEQRGP
jgi:hypothetical protein